MGAQADLMGMRQWGILLVAMSFEQHERHTGVPAEVLRAFGVSANPVLLEGGQGDAYRAGDKVLKRIEDPVEAAWSAETLNGVGAVGFRVPRSFRTQTGEWVKDGWTATTFVSGRHEKGRWEEKLLACDAFHEALKDVERPAFLATRNNPWSIADRVVWGEQEVVHTERLEEQLRLLREKLVPLELPSQVVHGDFTGNVLFDDELEPAVIDFSPYWRPSDFAKAIVVVDALVWEGADESVLELVQEVPQMNQLLLRAEMRRLIEIEECIKRFGKGTLDDIDAHKATVELLCNRSGL